MRKYVPCNSTLSVNVLTKQVQGRHWPGPGRGGSVAAGAGSGKGRVGMSMAVLSEVAATEVW